ncbi:MAG TPA: DUF3795 domain-containing protein [Bacilli bacterium]|nr:DUF3795 domain-containing protein [Bacilli bacterium]
MKTICGADCCLECPKKDKECAGCIETNGHPCGGNCIAANCIKNGGFEKIISCKNKIIKEVNSLNIDKLQIDDLNLLNGSYINMEYTLPNKKHIKLLEDNDIYWANQVEIDNDNCYGIASDNNYLLICKYGCNGSNPEIIVYKKI